MKKKIILITRNRARSLIPKLVHGNVVCYYLINDPKHYDDLRKGLMNVIEVRNLTGLFHEMFQEIKEPYCEIIASLNQKYDSIAWWGGQLASKNNAAAPLPLLHIIYFFCAKKIIAESSDDSDILLVLNSRALTECIEHEASSRGVSVRVYCSIFNQWGNILQQWFSYLANTFYFVRRIIQSRFAARMISLPPCARVSSSAKRVIIRSWVTKGVFDANNNFRDRNFGSLPDWLHARQNEVWTLPMFYNLHEPLRRVCKRMKMSGDVYLLPDHFLSIGDYTRMIIHTYRMARRRFENIIIKDVDVTGLFQEAVRRQEFNWEAMVLNLVYPMLKRLMEIGYDFDTVYYPFENNLAEKPFILGVRTFFPKAKIIGFQHTARCSELLSYYLDGNDKGVHPLPDRIICSGPRYLTLYRETGLPDSLLLAGSNLRFGDVFQSGTERERTHQRFLRTEQKIILLPLSYSQNLTFETFINIKEALRNNPEYKVYIRNHPLVSRKSIVKFLRHIQMVDYEFADEGVLQNWLPRTFAIVSGGWSVTILEAAAMGIPVVRFVPANTFSFDPFAGFEYPLEPVTTPVDIGRQLHHIDAFLDNDPTTFEKIGRKVLAEYFTKPDDETMKIFL
ncbi:MAG: hypothetical protein Q7S48_04840 [bacterium]|nr:hypothetical protein [bacterium]